MEEGVVKWFSNKKGYGFIEQGSGDDLFVHFSSIVMDGYKTLNEGENVSYVIEQSDRGPVAKSVAKV